MDSLQFLSQRASLGWWNLIWIRGTTDIVFSNSSFKFETLDSLVTSLKKFECFFKLDNRRHKISTAQYFYHESGDFGRSFWIQKNLSLKNYTTKSAEQVFYVTRQWNCLTCYFNWTKKARRFIYFCIHLWLVFRHTENSAY